MPITLAEQLKLIAECPDRMRPLAMRILEWQAGGWAFVEVDKPGDYRFLFRLGTITIEVTNGETMNVWRVFGHWGETSFRHVISELAGYAILSSVAAAINAAKRGA